jgi:hypothetical protein
MDLGFIDTHTGIYPFGEKTFRFHFLGPRLISAGRLENKEKPSLLF